MHFTILTFFVIILFVNKKVLKGRNMSKEQILGFNVCTYNLKELIENIFED